MRDDTNLRDRPAGVPLDRGVAVGKLVGWSPDGALFVNVDGQDVPYPARSVVELGPDRVGSEVVIAFEGGEISRPIVLGTIVSGVATSVKTLESDGERVLVTADVELELRCGKACIRLTRDGHVSIRGTDLLSRSSGSNRIKGGSIRLN